MLLQALFERPVSSPLSALSSSNSGTIIGGGGGWRAEQIFHDPFAALHGRRPRGIAVERQDAGHPQQAAAALDSVKVAAQIHTAEVIAMIPSIP